MGFRRSKRKADGKENATTGYAEGSHARGGSLDVGGSGGRPRKSQSAELSLCETISEEELRKLVMMPQGMDPNEWLATHGKDRLSLSFCVCDCSGGFVLRGER